MACEWIMDGISFQKIYGLCGLKGHIVEIRRGVTLVDGRTDDEQRNVKIVLEFWKQNSQYSSLYILCEFVCYFYAKYVISIHPYTYCVNLCATFAQKVLYIFKLTCIT